MKIILAEAAGLGVETGQTAATIHTGKLGVIHGSKTLLMQDDDGQIIEPYSISAGLDYPGIGPLHAHLAKVGRSEVLAITDDEAIDAAFELTELEGIIPAIESAHALAVLKTKQFKSDDILILCLSGRGDKDIETYLQLKHNRL